MACFPSPLLECAPPRHRARLLPPFTFCTPRNKESGGTALARRCRRKFLQGGTDVGARKQSSLWGSPALPSRKSPNLKEQKLAPDGKSNHSSTSPVPTLSCVLAGSLATHTLPQADRAQALNQGGLNHHKPSQCLAPAAGGNLLPQPPQPEVGELWYCLHLFFFCRRQLQLQPAPGCLWHLPSTSLMS